MVFSFHPDNTDMLLYTKQTSFQNQVSVKINESFRFKILMETYVFIKTVVLASWQAQAQICAEV